jgi:hypothetical protein
MFDVFTETCACVTQLDAGIRYRDRKTSVNNRAL